MATAVVDVLVLYCTTQDLVTDCTQGVRGVQVNVNVDVNGCEWMWECVWIWIWMGA